MAYPHSTHSDVVIVGCGPVGQLLGILVGQRGHSVSIVDKWPLPYPLPRAVHFDDEIARVLALAGIGDRLASFTEPTDIYEWRNAAGQTLLKFDWSRAGAMTWPFASMFSQPELESVLAGRLAELPNVTVRRGEEAVLIAADAAGITIETRDTHGEDHQLHGRYVVGCDGANSFVRMQMQTTLVDLGFFYDWLILDVVLDEPRVFDPMNLQICDPERPVTVVSGGPGRRRFEFMRLPHETKEELRSTDRAWEFLERFDINSSNALLERHAVYTFAARWAERWHDGKLLLAGDAAHLMPPFAGQGMCSGMRDAANLGWKLDLVLAGQAPEALLETYGMERSAHVQNAIGMSVALGNVICVTDPEAVAARDAGMIAAGAAPDKILPPLPPPMLTGGIIRRLRDGGIQPGAGHLSVQGYVAAGDRSGRFDAVVGTGFTLIANADPIPLLDAGQRAFLASIGAHVVRVMPPGAVNPTAEGGSVVDIDGVYADYFARSGYSAIVVRPDFYIFGGAETMADLPRLIDDLRVALEMCAWAAEADRSAAIAEAVSSG